MKKIHAIIYLSASLAALIYFAVAVDMSLFLARLRTLSVPWLLIGLGFFFLQLVLKAWRMNLIAFREKRPFRKMLEVQSLYALFNYILPGGIGDASLIALSKSHLDFHYSKGTGLLFIVRTLDILVSALFLFFFVLLGRIDAPDLRPLRSVAWLMGLLSVALLSAVVWIVRRPLRDAQEASLRWGKFRRFLKDFRGDVRDLFRFKQSIPLLLGTFLIGAALYIVFLSTCKALHSDLSAGRVLLVYLLMWPFSLLPIRGILNLGNHELSWTVPLVLLGYDGNRAAELAFGTHTVVTLHFLILGLILLALWGRTLTKRDGFT